MKVLGQSGKITEKRVKRMHANVYIGIDPGVNGGLAWISNGKVSAIPMPDTETDIWEWLLDITGGEGQDKGSRLACIEQQTPRPTKFYDKKVGLWRESVLASTSILYGNYMMLRGFLVAAMIPYEDVPPKRWQSALKITSPKGESKEDHKNKLKLKAQQLFPGLKITLKTCDAILLAEYTRRIEEGTLER